MEAKANAVDFQMRVKNNVQFRVDPLTGGQSRINPSRATRPTSTGGIDSNLQEIVEKAKSRDPFLPEVIFEKVPRFPESLGPDDGRIIRGETVIFPNLHPFAENHAVAVMSNAHYLPLLGFTQTQLKDTLLASQQFMNAVSSTLTSETGRWYPTLVWNYMPPSAGSIIHPHMQIFVEERPTAEVERVLDLSSKYAAEHKSSYYADLAATEEKLDQRFVAKNEQLAVLTPFAPRGFNEVTIYFPGVCSITDLSEKQVEEAAAAMTKVLAGYEALGVGSFNMASFSGPIGDKREDFWLHFKFFSRPYPSSIYTNDTGPTERMYDVWVINTIPEVYAQDLKKVWQQTSSAASGGDSPNSKEKP